MKCISIGVNFSGRIARDCENVIIHTTSNRGTQPVDRCHTSRFKVSPSAQGDVSSPGDEASRLFDDDCTHHVLVNIADVAVSAWLHRCLEGLGLILGDVAGIELPTRGSQRVGGAVLVGY